MNKDIKIKFNNQVNIGNPIYYWANIDKLNENDFIRFEDGLNDVIKWMVISND